MSDLNVSFEFFPPKTPAMESRLWESVERLAPIGPRFVSVTYGAGGSTRERTHATVKRIVEDTSLNAAAHLTCVGASRDDVDQVLRDYWAAGVRHIVALRGDPPEGIGERYTPHPGGYANAAELAAGAKRVADFEISVGCYPEVHPESGSLSADIEMLKRKVDAGAGRAITQFFFDPDVFLRYRDAVRSAGVDIPIVPGIMLQPNFKGLARMARLSGASVPDRVAALFDGLDEHPDTRELVTAQLAAELTTRLAQAGVEDFHFYTLNRANLAVATCRVLGRPASAPAEKETAS